MLDRPRSIPVRRPVRHFGVASLLGLSSVLVACGAEVPESLELGHPPVVLIVLDALAAAHVGHLGYPRETTPALDALAAEGLSFRNAFAPAPYTVASIPSLLTGRRPDTHGVTSRLARLFEEEETLAEALGRAGYRTRAAVANLNGGPGFGATQGFEETVELYRSAGGRGQDTVERDGETFHRPMADEVLPHVERWLGEQADPPLFLYLHILEPHSPYDPPAKFRSLWVDPEYDGPFARGDSVALVAEKRGTLVVQEADRQAARDLYDANLRWADHNVALILDQLREAGLYDDALIIATSDHGEAFWQHGERGHNDQLYDESVRVPLIVKFPKGALPGDQIGTQPTRLVSLLDVMPSISYWLDLPVGEVEFDGVRLEGLHFDVAPSAGGTDAGAGSERKLYLRSHHPVPHLGLRTATHKTILERREPDGKPKKYEYYSLTEDPDESEDLATTHRKEVLPKVQDLQTWIRSATINQSRRDVELTDAERDILEALGYAGD